MGEQRVSCAASATGECRWVEMDSSDGRPCWSLCALDTKTIRELAEKMKDRDE